MNSEISLTEKRDFSDFAIKLLSTVAGSRNSLDDLIKIGAEALGNPIAITDKSWKSIAITADIEIPGDHPWSELLTDGRLSAESVTSGIKNNLADMLERSDEPLIIHGLNMKFPRLMNRVSINGRLAATVTVVEYLKPFSDSDSERIKLFCDAVAAQLQKNDFRRYARGILYEEFIENLLDGKLRNPGIIEERIKTLNIGLKKNSYVFVFDITSYDPGRYSVIYMRDVLEKMLSGGQALIYNGRIVITASLSRPRDIFKTELIKLGEFLKKHSIRCGISRRCPEPHELRFYYEQALDAMRVGSHLDPDRHIYPYGEYAIYHIAEICSESGRSKTVCHPALRTLVAYDEEYGTSFTASLYAYLTCFKSVSKAAASLNIHRNTFVYHLRRIGEIMQIELSDNKTAQLIELSFRILEYEKKINFRHEDSRIIEREN